MNNKRIMPIKFKRLNNGSDFQIFAEPSRDIKLSTDKRIYTKVCDAYSVGKDESPERAIILDMDDLVIPLSRGGN